MLNNFLYNKFKVAYNITTIDWSWKRQKWSNVEVWAGCERTVRGQIFLLWWVCLMEH